jgi:hypothetical protein
MSKNWEERIQLRVISEMVELCGDLGDEDNQRYMSVNSAIRRVSGEDVCVERYRFHIKKSVADVAKSSILAFKNQSTEYVETM